MSGSKLTGRSRCELEARELTSSLVPFHPLPSHPSRSQLLKLVLDLPSLFDMIPTSSRTCPADSSSRLLVIVGVSVGPSPLRRSSSRPRLSSSLAIHRRRSTRSVLRQTDHLSARLGSSFGFFRARMGFQAQRSPCPAGPLKGLTPPHPPFTHNHLSLSSASTPSSPMSSPPSSSLERALALLKDAEMKVSERMHLRKLTRHEVEKWRAHPARPVD